MKYNYDSYGLYQTGKIVRNVVRLKVTMKEAVDLKVLREAVNIATNRYPYFKKRVTVNEEGAYVLVDNNLPVVVIPTRKKALPTGCKEVNYHMLYVDTEGKDIFFTISHSLAGGKGMQPWVMTCIYQYVTMKYQVELDASGVRKPESPFLPTELSEPDFSLLPKEAPLAQRKYPKSALFLKDYLNGFLNPFAKKEEYYVFTFQQSDFMKYCSRNDSSVASLITILHFKAFDQILPKRHKVIRGTLAHNPCTELQIPYSHCDFLSHIQVDYTREMANYSMEKLGTITRGQVILQSDATISSMEVRKKLEMVEAIDQLKGLKKKRSYAKKNNQSLGKGAIHSTYHINYTGYMEWGDLKDYIETFILIVDGHLLSEVSAMGDKIYMTLLTLVKAEKAVKAMCNTLDELQIPYKMEGPFPKNLPWQEFPRKQKELKK